jgi:hypothetical protein
VKKNLDSTKRSVFDYINSASDNKNYIWDDQSEKEYVPFLTNRFFSYFIDTILVANQININTPIDKKAHYDYFFNTVRSRKRFTKWPKTINNPEIDLICKYYGFSVEKAKVALPLLSEEQKKQITDYFGVDNE